MKKKLQLVVVTCFTLLSTLFAQSPSISVFSPTTGKTGDQIIIAGANFTGVTNVLFGGVPASSFTVISSSAIIAFVGSGATGDVTVVNGSGSGTLAGFAYIASPPTITSFAPTSGVVGTSVIIKGTNFSTVSTNNIVYFGAVRATVTSASSTQLTVTVPSGATFQPISVTNQNLTAYTSRPFTVTFSGGGTAFNANTFSSEIKINTGNGAINPKIGDLDGDGKPDIILASQKSNTISIHRNSSASIGNISFDNKVDLSIGTNPLGTAIADLDGDGKLDIIATSYQNNNISIYKNNSTVGGLVFNSPINYNANTQPTTIAVSDFDSDGKPDLVVGNVGSANVSVYLNTSTGGIISFANKVDFTVGSYPWEITVGDIDGDGKSDIITANQTNASVSILRNTSTTTGTISFANKFDITGTTGPRGVELSDLDNDGKLDIVVSNVSTSVITIFKNASTVGNIGFSGRTSYATATGGFTYDVTLNDFDGDGKIDIAVSIGTSANKTSLFRNISTVGNISFNTVVNYATGNLITSLNNADFDGDGKSDIVASNDNASNNFISILRNQIGSPTITSFTPTSGLAGTQVIINGSNFTGVTGVSFGGVAAASYTVISSTAILANVGNGASGNVVVTTATGAGSLAGFTYTVPIPTITSFSPSSGTIGSTVTITGTNFSTTAANNIVYFGAVKATVTSSTASSLTVTVPTGATYQPITVTNNNLTAYSSKPFIVTFTGGGTTFTANTFGGKKNFTTFDGTNTATIGDFDNDGKPDIAPASGKVSILRNISTSSNVAFAAKVDFDASSSAIGGINSADIDGDGKLDILYCNVTQSTLGILRNISTVGNMSFTTEYTFPTSGNSNYISIADFDGDGKPDIVTGNPSNGTVSVFLNTSTVGNISFATLIDYTTAAGSYIVAVGDIDGDGKPDIAASNQNSSTVSVLRNLSTVGAISFATSLYFSTGSGPRCVSLGDIDGDGKLDIVTGNSFAASVSLLRNTSTVGNISFATRFDLSTGASTVPTQVALIDLDGDGKIDITTANQTSTNTVSTLRNRSNVGSFSFDATVNYSAPNNPYGITAGDIDGDSKPEIIACTDNINDISVLRNQIGSPIITSFTPTSGPSGTQVIITGSNFTGATGVSFGGVAASSFTFISSTTIIATVGTGASGNVAVTTATGVGSLDGFVFTLPPPTITSFTPTTGTLGTVVTITGTNFTNATSVTFGGVAAFSFTVASATTILAVVNNGSASGSVAVTTASGTSTRAGFTYNPPPPSIKSFSPTIGTNGTIVTIKGVNFLNTTAVSFGGVTATTFSVLNDSTISAQVSNGASGNVSVTNAIGTGVLSGFVYSTVINKVLIIGAASTTTWMNDIQTKLTGTGKFVQVDVLDAKTSTPTVATLLTYKSVLVFSDASYSDATTLGNNLATYADAGGGIVTATFAWSVSPLQGNFATNYQVITPTGSQTTGAQSLGTIFLPSHATMQGVTNFSGGSSSFRSTATTLTSGSYVVANWTDGLPLIAVRDNIGPAKINRVDLNFYPPSSDARSDFWSSSTQGALLMANALLYTTSSATAIPPTITSFSPTSAAAGTTVTISGTNFTSATAVSFGGVAASSFTVVNATTITAVVGAGASGNVSVINTSGTGSLSGFVYLLIPSISSFSPANGCIGTSVNITGNNFIGVTSVTFGGNAANSFVVNSSTSITAVVGSGTSTGVISVTTSSGAANSSNSYIVSTTGGGIDYAYIPNQGSNSISVVNLSSNSIPSTINLGGSPYGIALKNDGSSVYVSSTSGSVYAISTATNTVTATIISGGSSPYTLCISPDGSKVYTGNYSSNNVSVINTTTNTVIGTVSSGSGPFGICANPVGNFVYVSNYSAGTVGVINTNSNTLIATIPVGSNPNGIIASPDGSRVYVANRNSNTVSVINTSSNSVIATINVGSSPNGITISPDGSTVYVGNSGSISVINTANNIVTSTITLSGTLQGLSVSADGSKLVVTNSSFNNITIFNTANNTVISTISGFSSPAGYGNFIANIGGTPCSVLPPTITSFSPTTAPTGTTITISGSNFTGATAVTFGGVAASSFTVVNSTTITAIVGAGASGNVVVTTPNGTNSLAGFIYNPPLPTISSFSPTVGTNGTIVTIKGVNFLNATAVSFGGVAATTFTVLDDSTLYAQVSTGASGNVSVTTAKGAGVLAGFVYSSIQYCSPNTGAALHTASANSLINSVAILGTTLVNSNNGSQNGGYTLFPAIGSTTASLIRGNIYSLIISVSDASIASLWIDFNQNGTYESSEWTLITANGSGTLNIPFSVPTNATLGLTGLRIRTRVAGAQNGSTDACTTFGSGETEEYFVTIANAAAAPAITSFTPTSATTGTTVTITGSNFTGTTAVSFGGVAATSFNVLNATTITAVVDAGASGNVSVTNATGTGSLSGFNYCAAAVSQTTNLSGCSSVVYKGNAYTSSIVFVDTLKTVLGCDSVYNKVTITVNTPIVPTFTQVVPICSGGSFVLRTTSNNGITGTWSPAINNAATTTYTFTPTVGQCATTATMTVTVTAKTIPTFTQVAAICNGGIFTLPTTSNNSISGTWSPVINNTATTTYTFTPTAGQCATTATMTVTVNTPVVPTFSQVAAICFAGTFTLPTTSNNGISGTWSPAINNTSTTTYTFTPSAGQCATTTTMTVVVNAPIVPIFSIVGDICIGNTFTLPSTSLNGIFGSWSPALNNTATTTYTFIPINGQCAVPINTTVNVNKPTFSITNLSICANALPYSWNGLIFSAAGSQTKTGFVNSKGCDSIATLNLTVKTATSSTTNLSICASALPYSWNGLIFTSAGTQTKTGLINSQGCDSSATLILKVGAVATTNPISLSGCNSVIYKSKTYTVSTVVRDTVKSVLGCDSIYNLATITVTIPTTPSVSINATATSITPGTNVTFTATPVNQGITPSYQWYKNGIIISGANSSSYSTNTLANKDSIYVLITSSLTCVTKTTAISNSIIITVNAAQYTLSGYVKNPQSVTIPNAIVTLNGSNPQKVIGNYNYSVAPNANYSIKVAKNNDSVKNNGVSVIDAILVQSHVLNKTILNSPYKIIAADVNKSGDVSTIDILYIKRLALGIDTTFSGNRLWAFVDSAYQFPDVTNPFPYKDSILITNLTSNKVNQNFIGVKLGDVNYDWDASLAKGTTKLNTPIELFYNNVDATNKEEIRIPIYVNNFKNMLGMQYTLNFNSKVLELKGIEQNKMNIEYGIQKSKEGKIGFLWNDEKGVAQTLADGSVLMELVFAKKAAFTHEDFTLSNDIASIEAWDGNLVKHAIVKTGGSIQQKQEVIIAKESWEVVPNPTTDGKVKVSFSLKETKEIGLKLTSLDGKILMQQKLVAQKGMNTYNINLQSQQKLAKGVYYLQANGIEREKVKVIVVE